MQGHLCEHPDAGDLIRGSGGVLKIRWARTGGGKSGRVRVCYYARTRAGQILMLVIYAKSALDAKHNIGEELLQSVRDLRAGKWARKTTFKIMKNGTVRRRIERADCTIEKEEIL